MPLICLPIALTSVMDMAGCLRTKAAQSMSLEAGLDCTPGCRKDFPCIILSNSRPDNNIWQHDLINVEGTGKVIVHCTVAANCGTVLSVCQGPVMSALCHAGTVISDAQSDVDRTGPVMVKGFATIDNVALINVEGTGMVGVHGTAAAIFGTIRDANCNVVMISQASSEHSVCFAVKQNEGDRAVKALSKR